MKGEICMHKTKHKLRKAFQNVTPNVLPEILSKTCVENESGAQKRQFRWKDFAAAAAAVVLLFGVGYAAAGVIGSTEFHGIDGIFGNDKRYYIGAEKAKEIAVTDILSIEKRSILDPKDLRAKLVKADGDPYYDVVVSFADVTYDYDIGADSGLIQNIRVTKDRSGTLMLSGYLSWQSARDAAFNHAGLGFPSLTQFSYEFKQGSCLYYIGFRDQVYDYRYIIDGYDGKVLQLDIAPDDDVDPEVEQYPTRQQTVETVLKAADVKYDTVTSLSTSCDLDGKYPVCNVKFVSNLVHYDYTLRMDTHMIVLAESSVPDEVIITTKEALHIALQQFNIPLDLVTDFSFEMKDYFSSTSSVGIPIIEVEFKTHESHYWVMIDAVKQQIMKAEQYQDPHPEYGADAQTPYFATNTALESANTGKDDVTSLSTVFNYETRCFDVKFTVMEGVYKVSVTGDGKTVVSENPPVIESYPDKIIGAEMAIASALKHLGIERSDVMYEFAQLQFEDAAAWYDVSFWSEGFQYECQVNAVSGVVKQAEKEEMEPVDRVVKYEDSVEIRKAFLKTYVSENLRDQYTFDDLSLRYYGKYDDALVVFVDGILAYGEAETNQMVADILFTYPTTQTLLVYKDGAFLNLIDAYEAGWLDYENLISIHHFYIYK